MKKTKVIRIALMKLVIMTIFHSLTANGQSTGVGWAVNFGWGGFDEIRSIAKDNNGNIYSTGIFHGTVDFDPGPAMFNLSAFGGVFIGDMFITKFDQAGNFIWAKQFGGSVYDDCGNSIAVDNDGNIYATGYFYGPADFDPGTSVYNLNGSGFHDIFILKLDSTGNLLWAKSLEGSGYDYGIAIAVDATGNVYTTGSFENTVDFDPDTGTFYMSSLGDNDMFVSKLDMNGHFLWAAQAGGSSYQIGRAITIDLNGDVYTTGIFQSTVDLDPTSGIFNLSSAGFNDAFIQKLSSSGNFIWAKSLGGDLSENGYSITTDADGNVYSGGIAQSDSVDYDPGSGTLYLSGSGYILKLDSIGNPIWAKTIEGNIAAIALDNNRNVYATGNYLASNDFDPGIGVYTLPCAGFGDIFVSKLDAVGNFEWANGMGDIDSDYGFSILTNGSSVYAAGSFKYNVDFDSGSGVYILNSHGNSDAFILELNQSPSSLSEINDLNKFTIVPNPSVDNLTITLTEQTTCNSTLAICNLIGEKLYVLNISQSTVIDVSNLKSGIYLVQITNDKCTMTKKFSKQ